MTYELTYSKVAEKQIKKLPKEDQSRIISVLERSRIRPHSYVKKVVGSRFYRIRAGDHRIIVDIINKQLLIYIIEVGNRKNIYKN